jgi:predicted GIY-YIG superfamily endonuclease
MNIIIPDEINTTAGGVYRIVFKDGRWYVGTASNLRRRIMSHISLFRRDFAYNGVMNCMKGYTGRIKFELVCLSEDFWERIAVERKEIRRGRKRRLNMANITGRPPKKQPPSL